MTDYDYLRERLSALRSFNVLPRAGGWDDQDADWARDVFEYLRIERRLRWERDQANANGGDVLAALLKAEDGETPTGNLFAGL